MRARTLALTSAVSLFAFSSFLPAQAESAAEQAAEIMVRAACKDAELRAKVIEKMDQQESKYRRDIDKWDFEVLCATMDLPKDPVNDTADPSPDATHTGWIYDARWSVDGKKIVSASRDGTVRVWDAETGKPMQNILAAEPRPISGTMHTGIARGATFIGDGTKIAASGDANPVRLYDVASGKATAELPFAHVKPDESLAPYIAASVNGLVFVGGTNDEVLAIDSATNAVKFRLPGHTENATAVAVSETAKLVATGASSRNGDDTLSRVTLWNLDTGEKVAAFENKSNDWPRLAFSRDGKQLAVAWTGDVTIYDVASKKATKTITVHPATNPYAVAFTLDGKGLISCYGNPILWDIASAKLVRHFGRADDNCHSVEVSPDGKYAVTGSMASDVRIWEIATGTFHRRLGRDVKPPR